MFFNFFHSSKIKRLLLNSLLKFTAKYWFIIAIMTMLCLAGGCRDREGLGSASEETGDSGLQLFLSSVPSVFPDSAGPHFCNRLSNRIAQIYHFVLACLHIIVFERAVSLV